MIVHHPAARYSPSRFGFPVSKLIALLAARKALLRGNREPRIFSFAFSHEQSALESNAVSFAMFATAVAGWAAVLSQVWPQMSAPTRSILAVFAGIAHFNLAIPIVSLFLIPFSLPRVRAAQTAIQLMIVTAFAGFGTVNGDPFWRGVAALWLAWIGLNVVAFPVVVVLRTSIRKLDAELARPLA